MKNEKLLNYGIVSLKAQRDESTLPYLFWLSDFLYILFVMLCVKGNFILGDVNVNTHNISIPYALHSNGRVASSPHEAEWAGTNMSYNVTQEYATALNSDGITEDTLEHTRLLSVSDEKTGWYNLTYASNNITITGIAQGDNSFIEYSPQTGLIRGFVKDNTKYDLQGGPDSAEASVHNMKQKGGEESGEF